MDHKTFRKHAHKLVDWMADYLENIEEYPVRSQSSPGDIYRQIEAAAPENGQDFEQIFADFKDIIIPGMTHWQHPSFHAYFPANSSPPSVLAEMLTATMGAQCMIWQTSPAAAELEARMMEWLAAMKGLPEGFTGVIQDTASTATLVAILTAREKLTDFAINQSGFQDGQRFAIYCSRQTHSSIEKGVKIAGFGRESLRAIDVDEAFALRIDKLRSAIESDLASGVKPLCVVATIGSTGSTAIDPLPAIAELCEQHDIWLHVDAAYAGSAAVLPEMRWMFAGMEKVDSYVFNPHKWLFTNFDCTAYYVRDQEALIRTFEILPEYLKTREGGQVDNYRDWGIPLGRRFRALKLWFVLRSYGVEGIREKLRLHIALAQAFAATLTSTAEFEVMAPVPLNTVCFRWKPAGVDDIEKLNHLNAELLETLNQSGKAYLTHTKLNGAYVLRMVIGQTNVTAEHVEHVWELIRKIAADMSV